MLNNTKQAINTIPSLAYLGHITWWQEAIQTCQKYYFEVIGAASLMAISNIACGAANFTLVTLASDFNPDLSLVLVSILKLFGLLLFALVFATWSLCLWLFKLTSISKIALSKTYGIPIIKNKKKELFISKQQQQYLGQVWIFGTLYLLLPILLLSIGIALRILAQPEFTMLGQRMLVLSGVTENLINLSIVFLSFIVGAYSFVLIAVSSLQTAPPRQTALLAGQLFFKFIVAFLIISVFIVILNIIFTTPQLLFMSWSPQFKNNFWVFTLSQLWFGISSAFVWPLTMLIFLEPLKKEAKLRSSYLESQHQC